jgi:ABC-type molybdate transport system substrate-binding protein
MRIRYLGIRSAVAGLAILLVSGLHGAAQAAELKLLVGNALKTVMDELGPQFEKATGSTLSVTVGTTTQLKDDLAAQGKVPARGSASRSARARRNSISAAMMPLSRRCSTPNRSAMSTKRPPLRL